MRRSSVKAFLSVENLIAATAYECSVAMKFPKDDLVSFGRELVLTKLLAKHNPNRAQLSTFLVTCLRRAMCDYAQREKRQIPITDMGEFDIEQALPLTPFVWPDERMDILAEKIGIEAWSAAEAILKSEQVQNAETTREKQAIAKSVLWDWMQSQIKRTLT